MEHDWASTNCERPEPVPTYAGQDRDAASAGLGKPASEEQFGLAAGMNEFRIELRNDLPLPANASVQVNERTWAHEDCRLTLWSVERNGKWQVVRAMRWPAGTDF